MRIIDDGVYRWEEVWESIKGIDIKVSSKEEIEIIKEFIRDLVHNKLESMREIEGIEEEIRDKCRYVIKEMLPEVRERIERLSERLREVGEDYKVAKELREYLELEDDLYALASYRSLIHYAHYMERGDDASQWVWKYNMEDTMGSIFYYSNQMILDNTYKSLIKQCPTGYG